MNILSVCAIIKNEGPYLQEWFDYHFMIGVEKFYLVLNDCTDESYQVCLKNPTKVKVVSYTSGQRMQLPAYEKLINYVKGNTEWAAFIDADEFLVPSPVVYNVREFIAANKNVDAILVPWRLFGSNGLTTQDNRPVLERFTRCQNDFNPHIKSIVRPETVDRCTSAHTFSFQAKYPCVKDTCGNLIENKALQHPGDAPKLWINHYVTKSTEECIRRRSMPRADTGTIHTSEFFKAHDRNDIEDLRALEIYNKCKR